MEASARASEDVETLKVLSLWRGQKRLLANRTHPNLILSAGVGYGKSHVGARWHYMRMLENPDSPRSAVFAPTYRLLKHINLSYYERFLTQELELIENVDFKVNRTDLTIDFKHTKHRVHFISAENYKTVVAWEFSHAWIDEPGHMGEDFFIYLTERVRCTKATVLQKFFTGVPQTESSQYFRMATTGDFESTGSYHEHYPRYRFSKNTFIMHASSYENRLLAQTYFDELKASYGWNKNLFLAHIYGLFVPITKNACYDFDRSTHVRPTPADPQIPLIELAWDFNPGQVTWIAMQNKFGPKGKEDRVIAECPSNARTTDEACAEFIKRFPPAVWQQHRIRVWGDASGYHPSTRGYSNDYDIIASLIGKHFPSLTIDARHSNPAVVDRVMAVNRTLNKNSMLGQPSTLVVDTSCKRLIESLTITAWDGKGGIAKVQGDTWTHPADALGYCIIEMYPLINSLKRTNFHY